LAKKEPNDASSFILAPFQAELKSMLQLGEQRRQRVEMTLSCGALRLGYLRESGR